jgi:hypothetical protein
MDQCPRAGRSVSEALQANLDQATERSLMRKSSRHSGFGIQLRLAASAPSASQLKDRAPHEEAHPKEPAMNFAESNRQNALRSTGPRTEEGKAAVSLNAVVHGGFSTRSEAVPFLGEDPAEFEALRSGFVHSLNPVGVLEKELVGKMASTWWRSLRAGRAEREGFEAALRKFGTQSTPVFTAFSGQCALGDGHNTERILRLEAQLEKGFFRLLHELERLQARRQGQGVTPPMVMDVNVSID